ncbi:MAG: extracellular solute-binding protein, partial [Longimicrobiales bacterium]
LARLQSSDDPEEQRVGNMIGAFFPNQDGRGTHVNVSGAGVTTHAKNRDNAIRLIEFLSSEEAQQLFAQGNQEYPANLSVQPSETLIGWGEFEADTLNLSRLGELNAEAVRIFDAAGWR